MSLHITRFLDRVRAAESRQQRDITLTLTEARDLHADITRLLLNLDSLREVCQAQIANDLPTQIEVRGGDF